MCNELLAGHIRRKRLILVAQTGEVFDMLIERALFSEKYGAKPEIYKKSMQYSQETRLSGAQRAFAVSRLVQALSAGYDGIFYRFRMIRAANSCAKYTESRPWSKLVFGW